jgi:radical SAM superfamily enzyme
LLENLNFLNNENYKEIIYDRVELVKPENRDELIQDLKARTGLPIHKVDIISLNYLKDTALVKAYYYAKESENILPTSMDND